MKFRYERCTVHVTMNETGFSLSVENDKIKNRHLINQTKTWTENVLWIVKRAGIVVHFTCVVLRINKHNGRCHFVHFYRLAIDINEFLVFCLVWLDGSTATRIHWDCHANVKTKPNKRCVFVLTFFIIY